MSVSRRTTGESPTLGAWGIGWQVLLAGLEITQFTYFQQSGSMTSTRSRSNFTYGLERICGLPPERRERLLTSVVGRQNVRRYPGGVGPEKEQGAQNFFSWRRIFFF